MNTPSVWRKSSRSSSQGQNCVETAATDRAVAVRDSKNPDGGQLRMSARQWKRFAGAVKAGKV